MFLSYYNKITLNIYICLQLSLCEEHQKLTAENLTIVPFLLHMTMWSSTLLKSMLCENLTQSKILSIYIIIWYSIKIIFV